MKNYMCTLNQNDLQVVEELLNNFPLGNVNVRQAQSANRHAQSILDFLGSKTQEVIPEDMADDKKKVPLKKAE